MLVTIPELQTVKALATHLRIDDAKIADALAFLLSTGLVAQEGDRFSMGKAHIHLGHDSENINKHHTNWRVQAMNSLDSPHPEDLHYSVIYSLSEQAAFEIKERILKMIKENLKTVEPSPEQVVYCNAIDFFKV